MERRGALVLALGTGTGCREGLGSWQTSGPSPLLLPGVWDAADDGAEHERGDEGEEGQVDEALDAVVAQAGQRLHIVLRPSDRGREAGERDVLDRLPAPGSPPPAAPAQLTRCRLRQSTSAVRCCRCTSVPFSASCTRRRGSWGHTPHQVGQHMVRRGSLQVSPSPAPCTETTSPWDLGTDLQGPGFEKPHPQSPWPAVGTAEDARTEHKCLSQAVTTMWSFYCNGRDRNTHVS